MELHTAWLPEGEETAEQVFPTSVTSGYLRHLLGSGKVSSWAADSEYERLVGAVLPCFWIYADVGSRLLDRNRADHPYANWLATYSDPNFAEATTAAVRILEAVLERSGDDIRGIIHHAFQESTRWEHAFFAAGIRKLQDNWRR